MPSLWPPGDPLASGKPISHRDWRDPDYIHVAVFKDRVEVRNPGNLLDDLTIEDIRRGNVSRRRNPLIADLLRRIQMIEAWGWGMPLILENAPTASFKEIGGLFIASFDRPSFLVNITPETTPETTPESAPETTRKSAQERPAAVAQATILVQLAIHPDITRKALAETVGLAEDDVKYHLGRLKATGRIRHVGPTKGGRWEVVSDAKGDGAGE